MIIFIFSYFASRPFFSPEWFFFSSGNSSLYLLKTCFLRTYLKIYYIQSSYVKWMSSKDQAGCQMCGLFCLSLCPSVSLLIPSLFFSPSFHNTFYNRGYSIFRDWNPQQTLATLKSYCKAQGLKNDLSHFYPNFLAEGRTGLRHHLLTPHKFWQTGSS